MSTTIIKSLDNSNLAQYISKQLNHFFPDNDPVKERDLLNYIDQAEERVFKCFRGIEKKYFTQDNITKFDHLHSDQYCMYLYMLSNSIYNNKGNIGIATKLYCLNKSLHSVDIYFTVQLPNIFLFVHPLGTIIGRSKFADNFICYQGVTVGCLNDGIFPEFQGPVILYANSSVLGDCKIGSNVCIAANCTIVNRNVPDDTIATVEEFKTAFRPNKKNNLMRPPFVYTN